MKRFLLFVLVAAAFYLFGQVDSPRGQSFQEPSAVSASSTAFRDGQQAKGSGTVVRILSDDSDGSRHQRFIIRIASGRTLLVSHNIDLAPRVNGIREGDTVEFYGEFASNSQGGVIHWTHHDPQGRHPDGWLRHNGRVYR